ncbi:N-terminal EF-hand calcium-binding protein 3 isoform X1 [Patagioenas fasciata]|uniref:N-terminal EF-hand calcium-binding protein 3 isoform X1 n=1 Tax=Patagioenas fasciata TaxID=372321 RepID=UPI003A99383D
MMACAELLAVCLLSADRGPAPRRQPLPIFHDIFRRADKNDDGKLSFEEFKNYFADGILSSEELWELFSGIDRRHSDNVDTEKLCDYFSAYLGEYRNVLSALEALNSAVLAAMDKTKLSYETSSKMEQFLTRFLLRETMHQLQSLQASLECAVDTVEEQAGRERKDIKKTETSVGLRSGRRCGRRGQKNICLSPTDPYSGMLTTGVCVEDNSQWMAQISRLQQLIEKLECESPRLEPLKEEAMCKGQDAHILVAKRQISVATSSIEEFRQAFRSYTEVTARQSSCLHLLVDHEQQLTPELLPGHGRRVMDGEPSAQPSRLSPPCPSSPPAVGRWLPPHHPHPCFTLFLPFSCLFIPPTTTVSVLHQGSWAPQQCLWDRALRWQPGLGGALVWLSHPNTPQSLLEPSSSSSPSSFSSWL